METMCGFVAKPVSQMWNGLGQNPHLITVGGWFFFFFLIFVCGIFQKGKGVEMEESFFVEAMRGFVASPVPHMWSGPGRNPHLAPAGGWLVWNVVEGERGLKW